ncbi:hypothetical protein ED733_000960 [Metarhizium rileyi]|uniref:Invertebrate defensins family profile domain-containing protein n=1 Tax=Metarhizium rileyi (strain RCEF 4871) TaxID=1649241 RepID=A0A5C6GM54_METRR|nr:hypothetical protein ED733_000960 [Metarhizium rileyi]
MKTTLILGLFTAGILAATAAEGPKPVSEVSATNAFAQDSFSVSAGAGSPDAYCGGLSFRNCNYACGRLGYRCWTCTSSYCYCSNSGC